MPQQIKYIGPTQTFQAAALYPNDLTMREIEVKEGESYLIDFVPDGQQVIINGQSIITPDSSIWVVFVNEQCRIPYSPECIENHWKLTPDG